MEEKTWNMESEIQLKISELELEYEYWVDVSNNYGSLYVNSNFTDNESNILFEMSKNLRELTYLKLEKLKKMI